MDAVKKKIGALKAKMNEAEAGALEQEQELNDLHAKAEAIEEENIADNEKICQLEDSLDEKESQVAAILSSLTENEKTSDEALQAKKILENRGNTDNSKISRLAREHEDTVSRVEEVKEKLDDVITQLNEHEEGLDEHEERLETAENRVKDLELEVTQVGNTLRSIETAEGQANLRSESGESTISSLSERLQGFEGESEGFEEDARELEEQLETLETQLHDEKESYRKAKEDLDAFILQIAEM